MSPKSTNFAPQKYNKNCKYANKIKDFFKNKNIDKTFSIFEGKS